MNIEGAFLFPHHFTEFFALISLDNCIRSMKPDGKEGLRHDYRNQRANGNGNTRLRA